MLFGDKFEEVPNSKRNQAVLDPFAITMEGLSERCVKYGKKKP